MIIRKSVSKSQFSDHIIKEIEFFSFHLSHVLAKKILERPDNLFFFSRDFHLLGWNPWHISIMSLQNPEPDWMFMVNLI